MRIIVIFIFFGYLVTACKADNSKTLTISDSKERQNEADKSFQAMKDECRDGRLKKKLDKALLLQEKSIKNWKDGKAVREHDDYFENEVPSILGTIISCMDKIKFSTIKMELILGFFLKTKGNASEKLNSYLYKLYRKFEVQTVESIQSYPKKDAVFLTRGLNFSWDNATFNHDTRKSSKRPVTLSALNEKMGLK